MQPTTITSIVLVLFGSFVVGWALYNLFGSWQPVARRPRVTQEDEIEAAVLDMRQSIEAYEREHLP